MKVLVVLPPCLVTRSEGFYVELSAYRTIPQILSSLLQHVQAVKSTPWRERGLVSRFLWASLRSLATDVVQLSLNVNNFQWLVTCSFVEDTGNMSIQAFRRRFRSSEIVPIHLTISMFYLFLDESIEKNLQKRIL